ncbi:DUF1707 SHOCT-like domain-containing protein [Micromonospora inaquosa]|uniref:DUF1707 SHOCT-like domain-containing protein n=1 Tax=Micromonospora inaquosa TaxID=2203716 RepID=UPI001ABFDB15|nr:DUF1707 domain-containing protein [Micromonospora inaquosa]
MNDIRVSNRDREAVVVRLSVAASEGRLTFAEFEDRSAHAYAAKTYGELDVLVADLPMLARGEAVVVRNRAGVARAHEGTALSFLALAAGWAWVPMYGHLHVVLFPGVAGVVFGLFGLRANASHFWRALATLGVLGGSLCVALQVAWAVYHLLD